MKSLKSKLMAAGAMLMVSAVMLTSASFAWFTVSTAPEMSNISVTMTTAPNLEIAGGSTEPDEVTEDDSGKLNTWGGTLPYTGTVALTQMAKLSGGTIQTVTYGDDGRTNGVEPATVQSDGDYSGDAATPTIYEDADGNPCAAVYEFWLRSNEYTSVTATVTSTAFENMSVFIDDTEITSSGGTATISLSDGSGENAGRNVAHVFVYVFTNGTTNYSDTRTGSFTGSIAFSGISST